MTNAASTDTVCAPADECRKTCAADTDCSGGTPKCCTDYSTPVCTTTESCPTPCSQTSDCNTGHGELCCTTIHIGDTNGVVSSSLTGICEAASGCPVACSSDSDCTGSNGGLELCCNGVCSSTCAKSCNSDSDCSTESGQLCCSSPVLGSPWYGFTETVTVNAQGPECEDLSACCENLSGTNVSSCITIAAAANEANCESFFEAACTTVTGGDDGGTVFVDANTGDDAGEDDAGGDDASGGDDAGEEDDAGSTGDDAGGGDDAGSTGDEAGVFSDGG